MTEEVVQIAFDSDMGDKRLIVLTSKGRIFASFLRDEKQFSWKEVPLPELGT